MKAGETREFCEKVVLESEKDFIATVVPILENKKYGRAEVRPSVLKNGKHSLLIYAPAEVTLTQANEKVRVKE